MGQFAYGISRRLNCSQASLWTEKKRSCCYCCCCLNGQWYPASSEDNLQSIPQKPRAVESKKKYYQLLLVQYPVYTVYTPMISKSTSTTWWYDMNCQAIYWLYGYISNHPGLRLLLRLRLAGLSAKLDESSTRTTRIIGCFHVIYIGWSNIISLYTK